MEYPLCRHEGLTPCFPVRPQGYHIEKQLYEMDALKNLEEEIDAALLSAGGANYDLGNSRSGVKGGNSDALKA